MVVCNTPGLRWRSSLLIAALLVLGGCGDDSAETATIGATSAPPPATGGSTGGTSSGDEIDNRVTGSIGDGPIVGARLRVFNKSGEFMQQFLLSGADYDVRIKTKGNNYALSLWADQGTDLVTGLAPDFDMVAILQNPSTRSVRNLNPFSTLIYKTAGNIGAINDTTVATARDTVMTRYSFGLDSQVMADPVNTAVTDDNIHHIVKSSETLGEVIRRTRDAILATGSSVDGNDIVNALAADLSDGWIDGLGGPMSDARIAAVANIATAAVLVESMSNQLRVNGVNAMNAMDMAILQVRPGVPTSSVTGNVPLNAEVLEQAIRSLWAAHVVSPDASIAATVSLLENTAAGSMPGQLAAQLPAGVQNTLRQATSTSAYATDFTLETINAQASGTMPAPQPEPLPEPEPQPVPEPEPTPEPEPVPVPPNNVPTISGAPQTTALLTGQPWSFTPTAWDADGDSLNFSVQGAPSWLNFNAATGQLWGTPGLADTGSYPNIIIVVSDGAAGAVLPGFTLTVTAPPQPNNPPTIAGAPDTALLVGEAWSFIPTAQDADGDNLNFSVQGAPAWLNFNNATGRLWGTPGIADAGNYPNIRITVSDGEASAQLPAFSLTVTAPQPVTGSASLNWQAPAMHTDGSALTAINGYRIYYGRDPANLEQVVTVGGGLTGYVIENLELGTWYFAIAAVDGAGDEGGRTDLISKTIN